MGYLLKKVLFMMSSAVLPDEISPGGEVIYYRHMMLVAIK
jgi:hypothetical protein